MKLNMEDYFMTKSMKQKMREYEESKVELGMDIDAAEAANEISGLMEINLKLNEEVAVLI